jgi:hypothetical protein
MEGEMRAILILTAAATLLLSASYGYEAWATMGAGPTGLKAQARSLSPVETASCVDHGMFCPKGSQLECTPVCTCVTCGAKGHKHAKHS